MTVEEVIGTTVLGNGDVCITYRTEAGVVKHSKPNCPENKEEEDKE